MLACDEVLRRMLTLRIHQPITYLSGLLLPVDQTRSTPPNDVQYANSPGLIPKHEPTLLRYKNVYHSLIDGSLLLKMVVVTV